MMRRFLFLLPLLGMAGTALARVGGGDSYSGGGGSSGGGSGDGGGAELLFYVVRFLFWLTVEYPVIGIPVDIVVLIAVIRWLRSKNAPEVLSYNATHAASSPPARLHELRRFDPNFSEITFSDFCYSLYARAHHARGEGQLDQYGPYLSAGARNVLRTRAHGELRGVKGIVIGSFRISDLHGLNTPQVTVTVVYQANYTEVAPQGESAWYVKEQWTLERARDIVSPPPEKAKADHCPRCGAALQTRTDGACGYCGVKIESGAFQWYVRSISLLDRQTRGPLLTGTVDEVGTSLPTVWQPHFVDRLGEFNASHPGFDWDGFNQRAVAIATELQDAWTARDWERVRPLESESLFQMHRYWIDAYRRQKLRNIVAGFTIERVEPVKIDSDAFYESITVRLHAHGRDHTVDEAGQVVAGSAHKLRKWTEYWTFIRTRAAAGADARLTCPNCGAPVRTGATGICDYCGGKLTTGTFDWILSRIQQDEAYAG
jgi:ribosomal protein L37AE/L43A